MKVIYAENKHDIIGQYIIFSHVLDQQIEKFGRTKTVAEETIRICKSEGVLREYLESREKEVIDIMITLFGQEYAVEAYAEEKARVRELIGVERTEIRDNLAGIRRVMKKLNYTPEKAMDFMDIPLDEQPRYTLMLKETSSDMIPGTDGKTGETLAKANITDF